MRLGLIRFALLLGTLACADEVVAPSENPGVWQPLMSAGSMSVTTEADYLNSVFVSANRLNNVLIVEGLTWIGESTLSIRLTMRTDVGTSVQTIDSLSVVAADVMYRPWDSQPQAWSAYRSVGTGTFSFTTLTSNRAAGRFEFSAPALSASAAPQVFRVNSGSFEVRF